MWRIALMCVTTAAGYAIGTHWDSPGVGSVIGFGVGVVLSFPQILGEVAEGVVDCID